MVFHQRVRRLAWMVLGGVGLLTGLTHGAEGDPPRNAAKAEAEAGSVTDAESRRDNVHDDFERIRRAWRAELLGPAPVDDARIATRLAGLRDDDTWSDLNYADDSRGSWRPATHWSRLVKLTRAYADPRHVRHRDPALGKTIQRLAIRWPSLNCIPKNWWYADIFLPYQAGMAVLLAPDLFAEGAAREVALSLLNPVRIERTATNRVWLSRNVLLRALFLENEADARAALDAWAGEIRPGQPEGLRGDGSFQQHGPMAQVTNYGMAFLNDALTLAELVRGTRYALNDAQMEVIRRFARDGVRWVVWNGYADPLAVTRQLRQGHLAAKGRAVRDTLARVAALDPANADDYRVDFTGHRHYWVSDIAIHRTPAFYASVRMNSLRTAPTEDYINYENPLGRYLSDGAFIVMVDGGEYEDVFATWDWTRIPGTTMAAFPLRPRIVDRGADKGKYYPRLLHSDQRRRVGESAFTGGTTDGHVGVAVYTQALDGVTAKKAYFFGPGAVVLLGADIHADVGYPVATTIQQAHLRGDVRQGDGWVWHDRIGYVGEGLSVDAGERDGDWRNVVGNYNAPAPDRRKVFRLTVEHGDRPRDASYACTVYPAVDADAFVGTAAAARPVVSSNTSALQAVRWPDGTAMAVFHTPGTWRPDPASTDEFVAHTPGVVLLRGGDVWAADPSRTLDVLRFRWRGVERVLPLPTGEDAGRTVHSTPGE